MMAPPKRWPFRWRLLTALSVMAASAMLIAGAMAYLIERSRVMEEVNESLDRTVQEYLQYTGADLPEGATPPEFDNLEDLILGAVNQSVNADDECTLGFIDDQTPWAHNGAVTVCSRIAEDRAILSALRGASMEAAVTIQRLRTSEGSYTFFVVPTTFGANSSDGRYAVVIDEGDRLAAVTDSYLRVYVPVAAAAVLLIIAVGGVLSGQILRPLRTLMRATEDLGADVKQRVAISGNDEVGELAQSMNTMMDKLEASFTSQRQLLDDVGHELRTPLQIIRGHLELTDAHNPAEVEDMRVIALDEIDRMGRLVDSLVTLAQADGSGFVTLQPTRLDVIVADVAEKARGLADRDWQATIISGDVTVMADPSRLTQALLELLNNAVKHSEAGSVIEVCLDRHRDQTGESAAISVTDHGQGIDAELGPHIFERFRRAPGTGHSKGAGLGLAIVARIVQAHGGRIDVVSESGHGSTFTITLPAIIQKGAK
jgi:signal transduction histidine kinase